jgi:hypothetical protein
MLVLSSFNILLTCESHDSLPDCQMDLLSIMSRYKNKPRDERLCSGCLKVENEVHFLFEYSTMREQPEHSRSSLGLFLYLPISISKL